MHGFDEIYFYGPGRGFFGAWHLIGPLFMLLILGLLVYFAIMTFRRTRGFGSVPAEAASVPASGSPAAAQTPLEVAKMRYAKGEITRDEFETLKQDLQ